MADGDAYCWLPATSQSERNLLLSQGDGSNYAVLSDTVTPESSDKSRTGVSIWDSSSVTGDCVASASVLLIGILFTPTVPYAFQQTGLFAGVLLCLLVTMVFAYTSVLCARAWMLMEEMHPDKYGRGIAVCGRPYVRMAYEAGGPVWGLVVWVVFGITSFGTGTTGLLVATSTLEAVLPGRFSTHVWLLICAAAVLPFALRGPITRSGVVSSIGGAFVSLCAVSVLATLLYNRLYIGCGGGTAVNASLPDTGTLYGSTAQAACPSDSPFRVSVTSFWLGTSILIFSVCGVSVVPNIILEMKHRSHWSHISGFCHATVAVVDIAIGTIGVEIYGWRTNPNVLVNVQCNHGLATTTLALLSSALFIGGSLFLCVLNVTLLAETAENGLKLPNNTTNYKQLLVRTAVLLVSLGAAELMPQFDKYVALLGASALSAFGFIFPPLFYYWLSKASGRRILFGQKAMMLVVFLFGAVSSLACTYSSAVNLFRRKLPAPCL